ncbi:hypothetical protein BGZ80_008547, partial [Entomortierella chlamydospora]
MFMRLNDTGMVGKVTRARLYHLQCRLRMITCPTMEPQEVRFYNHSLISKVCTLMADRQFAFHVTLAPDMGLPKDALTLLEWCEDRLDRE